MKILLTALLASVIFLPPAVGEEACTIWTAFNQDAAKAQQVYGKKGIQISGWVDDIGVDKLGLPQLTLKCSKGFELRGVIITLKQDQAERVARLQIDDRVTITADFLGKLGWPFYENGEL